MVFPAQGKRSGDVESEVDVAIKPITLCFGDETVLVDGYAVGKEKLKHVSACLDVEPQGEAVVEVVGCFAWHQVEIFSVDAHALGKFQSAAGSQSKHRVLIVAKRYQVPVYQRGSNLDGEGRTEFPGNKQLMYVGEPARKIVYPVGVFPSKRVHPHRTKIAHRDRHIAFAAALLKQFKLHKTIVELFVGASSNSHSEAVADAILETKPDGSLIEPEEVVSPLVEAPKMV